MAFDYTAGAYNGLVQGQPRTPGPIRTLFDDLKTWVNGANVTDANLASPNNSAYKTLLVEHGGTGADLAAGTYLMRRSGDPLASGGTISSSAGMFSLLYFDDADFLVGGLTQKLRLRAQVSTNATAWSSVTATFGLYPVTFAGGADALVPTLGTVVTGSTVAAANPLASTPNSYVGTDFAIPSDGVYAIGFVLSATLTNNALALLSAQLQTRNV